MEASLKSTKTHFSPGREDNLKIIGQNLPNKRQKSNWTNIAQLRQVQRERLNTIEHLAQFEKSHDLQLLKMNVNQHMNKHGLALLKYLPHPSNDTKVVNVIDNHRLFDKKKGATFGNKVSTKHYDGYERAYHLTDLFFSYCIYFSIYKRWFMIKSLNVNS